MVEWIVGVVKFLKVPLGSRFSTDFRPKVTDQQRIFCFASIWASKLEAVKLWLSAMVMMYCFENN